MRPVRAGVSPSPNAPHLAAQEAAIPGPDHLSPQLLTRHPNCPSVNPTAQSSPQLLSHHPDCLSITMINHPSPRIPTHHPDCSVSTLTACPSLRLHSQPVPCSPGSVLTPSTWRWLCSEVWLLVTRGAGLRAQCRQKDRHSVISHLKIS